MPNNSFLIKHFLKLGTQEISGISTDTTLSANSDNLISTQKAIKTYVDSILSGGDYDYLDSASIQFTAGYYSETTSDISGHFDGIDDELGYLNTDISNLSSQIDTNTSNISTNASDIQTVSSQVDTNTSDISTLSGLIGTGDFIPLSGADNISGNLTPALSTLSLGTSANPWDSLHLNPSSLYLGTYHFTMSGSAVLVNGKQLAYYSEVSGGGDLSGGAYDYLDAGSIQFTGSNYSETSANISGHFDGINTKFGERLSFDRFPLSGTWPLSGSLTFETSADANNLVIKDGKVGVGRVPTTHPFEVEGTIRSYNGNDLASLNNAGIPGLLLRDSGVQDGHVWVNVSGLNLDDSDASNSPSITIKNGNVGIGGIYPDYKLHIKSSGTSTYMLAATRSGDTTVIGGFYEDGDGDCELHVNSKTGAKNFYVLGDGKVGIGNGLTPTRLFHVQGSGLADYVAYIKNTYESTSCKGLYLETHISGATTDELFKAVHGGTTRLLLQNDGNVGFGTGSPTKGKVVISGTGPNDYDTLIITSSITDNTNKYGGIATYNYDSDEEPVSLLGWYNQSSAHDLRIGGGQANQNAATSIGFYTAANTTTLEGTQRLYIDSSGKVGIGGATLNKRFNVDGDDSTAIQIQSTNVNACNWNLFCTYTGSTGVLGFHNDAAYTVAFHESGKVAIGNGAGIADAWVYMLQPANSSTDNKYTLEVVGSGSGGNQCRGLKVNIANTTSSRDIVNFQANGTQRFIIRGDGTAAFGNEGSPDTDAGGLCLNQGDNDGNIMTFKSSDVAHGITDWNETDTYGAIRKWVVTEGGLYFRGLSENEVGLVLLGGGTGEDTASTTSADGTLILDGRKKTGTGLTSLTSDGNIVVFRNSGSTKHIFKGDGDIYTDTGFVGSYDKEKDPNLVDALRYELAKDQDSIEKYSLQPYVNRLNELGIIENGFVSHQKSLALQLGALGQLFNMIKGIAKEFNIEEEKLLEFAKQY